MQLAMCTQRSNAIAILAAVCFIILTEAAPLSHQNQLQVALEKIAELKGDTFNSCCNVRPFFMYAHIAVLLHFSRLGTYMYIQARGSDSC